jgi:hypothetical protein
MINNNVSLFIKLNHPFLNAAQWNKASRILALCGVALK